VRPGDALVESGFTSVPGHAIQVIQKWMANALAGAHRRIRTPLAHRRVTAVVNSVALDHPVVGAAPGVETAVAPHPHHRLAHHQTQTAIVMTGISMVAKELTVANSVVAVVVTSACSPATHRLRT
jgi:hypothetical protein